MYQFFFHLENLQTKSVAIIIYSIKLSSLFFFNTLACLFFLDFLTAKFVITDKCLQDRIIAKFVSFVKEVGKIAEP